MERRGEVLRWLPWLLVLAAIGLAVWMLGDLWPAELEGSSGLEGPADAIEMEGAASSTPQLVGVDRHRSNAQLRDVLALWSRVSTEGVPVDPRPELRRQFEADPGLLPQILAFVRTPQGDLKTPEDRALWYQMIHVLEYLGEDGARALAALLEEPSSRFEDLPRHVLFALMSMRADAAVAVDPLIAYFHREAKPRWRVLALRTLGAIGPEARAVSPILFGVVRPPLDDTLAGAAARALMEIEGPTPEVLAIFRAAIEDEDTEQRAAVLGALALAGPEAASFTEVLLGLLRDSEPQVRTAAASVLGAIGTPSKPVLEALREQLEAEEPRGKRALTSAMIMLGETGREAVLDVLQHGDDVTDRLAAAESLQKAGGFPANHAQQLLWILENEDAEISHRRRALGVLKGMPPWPADSDVVRVEARLLDERAFQGQAIHALATNPDPAVRARLHVWAETADESERFAAGAALRAASHDVVRATELLLRVAESAEDPRWAREALCHLLVYEPYGEGPRVIRIVEDRLAQADPVLSGRIVQGLGNLQAQADAVVPILLRALQASGTRWQAAHGLSRFPAHAATSVPALLEGYAGYGAASGYRNPPVPIRAALEELGPRWSGTRAALDAAIARAPEKGRAYLEDLKKRIVR